MTDHTAHLETVVGIIRVFPPGAGFGDPYSWSAVLVGTSAGDREIAGAMRAPTRAEYRAIRDLLAGLGIARVKWTRHNAGRDYEVTHRIRGVENDAETQEPT